MSFFDKPNHFRRRGVPGLVDRVVNARQACHYQLQEKPSLAAMRRAHAAEYAEGNDPLVSIIIATYNRSRILVERTIPSLLAQTYSNIEVLVVGDHCIDDTEERMNEIKDPRVRFVDLPERGRYPETPEHRWFVQGTVPRNAGLSMAKGAWFNWISDDDILLPHCIESLLRFAQAEGAEFVSASYEVVKDGQTKLVDVAGEEPRIGGMQTWLYRSYLKVFPWNTQSWRKPWNRPTDYELQDRLYRAGVTMRFLDKVVAFVPPVEGTNTVGLDAQLITG